MSRVMVYLAGPIAGCTKDEANNWRKLVTERLNDCGIVGVSPLRCEPTISERYKLGYDCNKFGTARAIGFMNYVDVQRCDAVLAIMPRSEGGQSPYSLGTMAEIAWAHAMDKPCVVVSDDPYIQEHPLVNFCTGWVLPTVDEALEVIVGIFDIYGDR